MTVIPMHFVSQGSQQDLGWTWTCWQCESSHLVATLHISRFPMIWLYFSTKLDLCIYLPFARHLNAIPKIFSYNTNLLVRDLSFFFCCTSSLYCEWEQEWKMEKVQRLMVMYLTEVTLEVKYARGPLSHFQRLHRIRTLSGRIDFSHFSIKMGSCKGL